MQLVDFIQCADLISQKVAGNRKGGRKMSQFRLLPPFLPPFCCTKQEASSFFFFVIDHKYIKGGRKIEK
jgi:hypothetical protein